MKEALEVKNISSDRRELIFFFTEVLIDIGWLRDCKIVI